MEVNRESPASKRDTGYDMNKKQEGERRYTQDGQKESKEREDIHRMVRKKVRREKAIHRMVRKKGRREKAIHRMARR